MQRRATVSHGVSSRLTRARRLSERALYFPQGQLMASDMARQLHSFCHERVNVLLWSAGSRIDTLLEIVIFNLMLWSESFRIMGYGPLAGRPHTLYVCIFFKEQKQRALNQAVAISIITRGY